MKRILVYKLFFIFGFLIPSLVQAQYSETESIYKSFPADDNTKLMLSNKYGNVVCETWDKDSIGVSVKIRSSSKKRESIERIMNSVEIENINFGNTVEVETSFTDNASLIKSYLGKLDPFNSNELSIEYVVQFPDGIELEINNRFGNVSITKSSSDIEIDLEYGNLRLESMTGDLNLDLKSGRLIGRDVKRLEIEARNCDIRFKKAEYVIIDASHCDTRIDDLDFARIDITGGELDLEKVNTLNGLASSNAVINIEMLYKDLEIQLKNSAIMVEEFDVEVGKIIINEVSSTVDLNITDISFSLEADVEESQFSVPKTITNIERVVHDERKESRSISFNYGSNDSSSTTFKLKSLKGSIFLIED